MNITGPFRRARAKGAGEAEGGEENVLALLGDARPADADVPVLTHYLRMVVRRKWIIVGAVLIAVLLGLLLTVLATPLYTATTRVEISRTADRIVDVDEVERETSVADLEFYQTQYGLLRSRTLAERVVRDLELHDNRAFFELFDAMPEQPGAFAPANREGRVRSAAFILLSNVTVSPVRGSSLVDISFTSPDSSLSARIANSWARNFIQGNLERRFQSTAYAREFLEGRLAQLRQRLEEAERQAVAYAANQGLISVAQPTIQAGESSEPQSLVADNLARLNAELAAATAERMRAQSRVGAGTGSASNEALASPILATLRQRRAEAASEYGRMMAQFEPEYPAAVALSSQIERLDASIAAEEARIARTLRSNYQQAAEREQAIAGRVESLKSALVDQQQRRIQYNIYQRDIDTTRQLYQALLQRYKEIGVAGGVGANNVTIIDEAEPPMVPSSPNLLLNLLLSVLVGSMAGIGIALAREHVDEVISDPSQVTDVLPAALLGTVPMSELEPADAVEDPKSSLTEAYLAVQTSLQFVTSHGIPRSLSITSTAPREGKSTTSYALARSMARSGRKVALVDGDMRSPSVHHFFGVPNQKGLSNYLAGDDSLESLLHTGLVPNLAVLTAGPPPPNAADLLSGDRIVGLLETLGGRFDHIIVDSPPVMGLADSPLISSQVEATVYVIAAHSTRLSLIRLALQRMAASHARIIGIVLTKFDTAKSHYGYGYDYGYSYATPTESEGKARTA